VVCGCAGSSIARQRNDAQFDGLFSLLTNLTPAQASAGTIFHHYIEREARREVERSGRVFAGLRPEGRDHLRVTSTQLVATFAPLSLLKQRLRG
jgi:hypothetical protein